MHPADTPLLMAAIILNGQPPNDENLAASVIYAHRLIELNLRHEQWSRAAHDARFKSKWFPTGEPHDLPF